MADEGGAQIAYRGGGAICGNSRELPMHRYLRIALGLLVALGIAATRAEKLYAETFAELPKPVPAFTAHGGGSPFDPRRVPQSGGMAARLLAGIKVKFPA
jgi:hypothetical protein